MLGDLVAAAGLVSIAVGIALIYPPAALIVCGAAAVVLAVGTERR